jgi:hypothetical protein
MVSWPRDPDVANSIVRFKVIEKTKAIADGCEHSVRTRARGPVPS